MKEIRSKNKLSLIFFGLLLTVTLSMEQKIIEAFLHQNITLTCNFKETVQCSWKRNSNSIDTKNRYSSNLKAKNCDLHIQNVSHIDNANWTCMPMASENDAGINNQEVDWYVVVKNATIPPATQMPESQQPTERLPMQPSQATTAESTDGEQLPVAVVVASAASGALLALILGITIVACYRCRKPPKNQVLPAPVFLRDPNTFNVHYTDPNCMRYSQDCNGYANCGDSLRPIVVPKETYSSRSNKPESRNSEDSHFYHEIIEIPS